MIFTCTINGRRVSTSLYYSASFKCKNLVPQSNPTPSLAELFKMERCIAYAEMHKEFALSEISSKLEKDCTSESPNAFWTREKYFVSLPFNLLEKPKAQKASVALMSPSERQLCANKIKELLDKGLIEPSKSPWACRSFIVNKHSEIKRGKPIMVVNFKPLNKVLELVHYPLPDKSSILQRI